ncbi:uncharacterized protein E0L32_007364 [Thyridium curvatum]|uniref:Uncharacterized protein n=1 Tax=Thyridium curvatum TaxID=1093900 RepID=A0A507AYL2_9PEZI|nr:uncharacterized protein E0L32_007364 [Thyridium curvatum]TPX11866.1 hypothetical protein E0L32_007364 [Thyridium curvatum]
MAEATENPPGAPGEAALPAQPATASGVEELKQETPLFDQNAIPGLLETIQASLKRQRTPGPESNGDEKRQKTEPEPSTDDWESMLQNALGDAFPEQLAQDISASALDQAPLPTESAAPTTSAAPSRPQRREQKKLKFFESPTYIIRSMGLPLLASLRQAVQILLALSERSREETVKSISNKTTDVGKAYGTLKAAFDQARRMFSESSPILFPEELEIKELGDQETIQMANMATICASLFEAGDVSLSDIHEHFLAAFVTESVLLTDELLDLFIDFKIRVAVEDIKTLPEGQSIDPVLEKIFPSDLEEQIKQAHPDASFAGITAKLKQDSFISEVRSTQSKETLAQNYTLNVFRDTLSTYLQSNIDTVLRFAESQGIEIPAEEDSGMDEQGVNATLSSENDELAAALQAATSSFGADLLAQSGASHEIGADDLSSTTDSLGLKKLIEDSLSKEISAAMPTSQETGGAASSGGGSGLLSLINEKIGQNSANLASASPYQTSVPANASALAQSAYASHYAQYPYSLPFAGYQTTQFPPQQPAGNSNGPLPPNQSSPSAVLYQRARQAAAAKSSAHARREGLHSTRRPWTAEEEQALMHGLDQVKGPHWSQILQLYGPNGTVSDILKDRSQVQLKDKARNLKLFFLKTNSEMPYYLQCVTGELKTRAPSQAARKEAEERARMTSEEDQARLQGVMALAGGLQNNPPRPQGSPGMAAQVQRPQQPTASPVKPSPVPAAANASAPGAYQQRMGTPTQHNTQQAMAAQGAAQHYASTHMGQPHQIKAEPASSPTKPQHNFQANGQPRPQPIQQAPQQPFQQANQQQMRQPVQQQVPRPIAQAQPQVNPQARPQTAPQGHIPQQIQPQPQVQGQLPLPQAQTPQQQPNTQQHPRPQPQLQVQMQAKAPQQAQPSPQIQQAQLHQQQRQSPTSLPQQQPPPLAQQQPQQQQQQQPLAQFQQSSNTALHQAPPSMEAASQAQNNHDATSEASLLETLKAATAAIPG